MSKFIFFLFLCSCSFYSTKGDLNQETFEKEVEIEDSSSHTPIGPHASRKEILIPAVRF